MAQKKEDKKPKLGKAVAKKPEEEAETATESPKVEKTETVKPKVNTLAQKPTLATSSSISGIKRKPIGGGGGLAASLNRMK